MFNINIHLRFALMAICFLGGLLLAFTVGFWYALPLFLVSIILTAGYILLGTVQSAAEIMQTQDFDAAAKRLKMTWKPDWLFSYNRAYYQMLTGTIAMQRKDMNAAETAFLKANEIGMPGGDNEKAMVWLQLANIQAVKEKWNIAQNYLKKAKEYSITEPMLRDQMKQMDLAIAQRGQMKVARQMQMQNGGMMQFSGKRRRPKMR